MNIYDIAELAGVSIATVSRVVNNSSNVSMKTREKVLEVMKQEGYTPNAFARGLGLGSMKSIGIICPDVADIYMARAVGVLEEQLKHYNYQTLLMCSGDSQESKQECARTLLNKKVDALILIGSTYAEDGTPSEKTSYIEEAAHQIPIFLVNGALPYANVYSTCCHDFQAVYDATTSMIKNHCKSILFLYNSSSYSTAQKMNGYEQALRDSNLPVLGELKVYIKNEIHHVRDILLLKKDIAFDGVITTEDSLAIGVLKYAKAAQIDIPRQLNVIGYNNSFLAKCCEPELSSIDSKVEDICKHTIKNLLTVLEEGLDGTKELLIEGELIRRCTTDF